MYSHKRQLGYSWKNKRSL